MTERNKHLDPRKWFEEEAAELVLASQCMSKADVLNEAVDVLYTLVLLCEKHGITQAQVLEWHERKSIICSTGLPRDKCNEARICTEIAFGVEGTLQ